MIDYSDQIGELQECKKEFDAVGKRLFDLEPDTEEKDFSTQEMFALSARIILIRKRVGDVIDDIQDRLVEEGGMEQEEAEILTEVLHQEFHKDDCMLGTLVEDIALLKNNQLALSVIERYEDMLLSIIDYCET